MHFRDQALRDDVLMKNPLTYSAFRLETVSGIFFMPSNGWECSDRVMFHFGTFQKGKTNFNGTVLRADLKCR